ncbi:MAG: PDC sensor domain-containing protein [Gammaproteobacteria bacterium]|nr:PDC sensor domain-containing protein [Gammaproteobacteria bacterium]MDH5801293.1 PDC sensor domain-containing protein [Gammaproteobacteria bacterium]
MIGEPVEQNWKIAIQRQREELSRLLQQPLTRLALQCETVWPHRDGLNQVLLDGFPNIPHCTFLYVLDTKGIQVCDNVAQEGLLPEHFQRDRSQRPYMKEAVPSWGFLLSEAYVSMRSHRPSLTALHLIRVNGEAVGYLGADFDLRDLPVTSVLYEEPTHWQQIKGDPSIRSTVFQQMRVESKLDKNREQAFSILEELFTERGVFQAVIHFSSSRATVWFFDDPYRYRILNHEALADPDICLAYPLQSYPADAVLPKDCIEPVLVNMQRLRMEDETIYLRSASINIFNGIVSLTFSCDGSHYMRYDEFLDKDAEFWFGA